MLSYAVALIVMLSTGLMAAPRVPQIMPADLSALEGTPIALVGTPRGLMVADYLRVYLFDGTTLKPFVIEKDADLRWQPTALAVAGNTVFIANYTGNNILSGTIDFDSLSIRIERVIADDKTISPEGIDIHDNRIAVANYDGNNVQVFNLDARGGATAACRTEVGWAHGVTFADGYIFATSLRSGAVLKIDPDTCTVVGRIGRKGWGRGEFLWPTAVARMGFGQVIVSDAHTGKLTVLSTDTMSVIAEWGSNGPGAFNMPYGVTSHEGRVWVASTFSRSLVELPDFSWERARFYPFTPNAWSWKEGAFPRSAYLSGETRAGYVSRSQISVQGQCYYPAYKAVTPCNTVSLRNVRVPEILRGSHFYFVQGSRAGAGVLLSSPQNGYALYYPDRGGPPSEVAVGLDAWVVDGALVGPGGPIEVVIPGNP